MTRVSETVTNLRSGGWRCHHCLFLPINNQRDKDLEDGTATTISTKKKNNDRKQVYKKVWLWKRMMILPQLFISVIIKNSDRKKFVTKFGSGRGRWYCHNYLCLWKDQWQVVSNKDALEDGTATYLFLQMWRTMTTKELKSMCRWWYLAMAWTHATSVQWL